METRESFTWFSSISRILGEKNVVTYDASGFTSEPTEL